ncbi:hypothetical protein BGX28_007602, partial [Mortierella sp. GBA30]
MSMQQNPGSSVPGSSAGRGPSASKRRKDASLVVESAPAKRMRNSARGKKVSASGEPTLTAAGPASNSSDPLQVQSGFVDNDELTRFDSEESDFDLDDFDEENESRASLPPTEKKRRRGPRGKYRVRANKSWAGHFINRKPPILSSNPIEEPSTFEGLFTVAKKTRRPRKKKGQDDTLAGSADPASASASQNASTQGTASESVNTIATATVASTTTAMDDQEKETSQPNAESTEAGLNLPSYIQDPSWLIDPPAMEYPYLQEAFPYSQYEPPTDRVDTVNFGDLPQPLPIHWHTPQGNVAVEDLFSLEKIKYATAMVKKVDVDPSDLRMDVYYQRGFELASRRMLDRVRAKKREEEDRIKAVKIARGEGLPLVPSVDPSRVYNAPPLPAVLDNMDTGVDSSTEDTSISVPSVQASTGIPGGITGSSGSQETASTSALNSSDIHMKPVNAQEVVNPTAASTVESTPLTTTTSERTTEAESIELRDRRRRTFIYSKPTVTDYYQVNAFLALLFVPGGAQESEVVPLSPEACRILQTLLLGLENKMLAMGCHLQRQEVTKRLALIDALQTSESIATDNRWRWQKYQKRSSTKAPADSTTSTTTTVPEDSTPTTTIAEPADSATITPSPHPTPEASPLRKDDGGNNSPYRRLARCDVDEYVLGTQPGERSDPGMKRPYISNPLEIPATEMDPFLVARDYMEKKALEARIRAAEVARLATISSVLLVAL